MRNAQSTALSGRIYAMEVRQPAQAPTGYALRFGGYGPRGVLHSSVAWSNLVVSPPGYTANRGHMLLSNLIIFCQGSA